MNSGGYITCVVVFLTFVALIVLSQRWRLQQQRRAAPCIETAAYVPLDEVKVNDLDASSECIL